MRKKTLCTTQNATISNLCVVIGMRFLRRPRFIVFENPEQPRQNRARSSLISCSMCFGFRYVVSSLSTDPYFIESQSMTFACLLCMYKYLPVVFIFLIALMAWIAIQVLKVNENKMTTGLELSFVSSA